MLCGCEISGLQVLTERGEILLERGDRRVGVRVAAVVMMAVMLLTGCLGLLRALLNRGEILLGGGEIAGLEILTERLECLEDWI